MPSGHTREADIGITEALLRWQHPERGGFRPTASFLSLKKLGCYLNFLFHILYMHYALPHIQQKIFTLAAQRN